MINHGDYRAYLAQNDDFLRMLKDRKIRFMTGFTISSSYWIISARGRNAARKSKRSRT